MSLWSQGSEEKWSLQATSLQGVITSSLNAHRLEALDSRPRSFETGRAERFARLRIVRLRLGGGAAQLLARCNINAPARVQLIYKLG